MIWRIGYALGAAGMVMVGGVFILLFEWGPAVAFGLLAWMLLR